MKGFLLSVFRWLFYKPTIASIKELKDAGAVIVFAFGQLSGKMPDQSDKFLAKKTKIVMDNNPNILAIIQEEIAKIIHGENVISIGKDNWFDSFEMAKMAKADCDKLKIKKIIVIAHPNHVKRCVLILIKMGFDVLGIMDTTGCPYDKNSVLPWTRSPKIFIPREVLARIKYLLEGKM